MADQFTEISAEDLQAEREWETQHAGRNSGGCYALAISELRRMREAGQPIESREYGPRDSAAQGAA